MMFKIKKVLLFTACVALASFSIFFIIKNEKPLTVSADTYYLSDADYTNNDQLLTSTGVLSNKTIQNFSTEVKNATNGTCFDELEEVIPKQYNLRLEYGKCMYRRCCRAKRSRVYGDELQ